MRTTALRNIPRPVSWPASRPAFGLSALDVPPLKAHVNDYARMFSGGTVQEMERLLTDFEAAESTQIVVLTIPHAGW